MRQRSSTARLYALCICLVLGAAVAWTVQAAEPSRDAPAPTQVRDLDYGDVLFHFFQDDYFESIVRLEVVTRRQFATSVSPSKRPSLVCELPTSMTRSMV